MCEQDSTDSVKGLLSSSCDYGNEISGSIQTRGFLDQVMTNSFSRRLPLTITTMQYKSINCKQ